MRECRVKICGITRPEDAREAARLGADYVGVIFAESPRRVDLDTARAVREAAPDVRLVGVFVDATPEEVAQTARACHLDLVQLHGDESPETCAEVFRRTALPVIKAWKRSRPADGAALGAYETTSYFLFDLDKTDGDEAREAVWEPAAHARALGFRVFLAGRLTPDSVREAVERTKAFAVDVCRGVESAPGIKDAEAIARFIEAVKA